ncbi:MAG: response regulator [Elusimicrobiales bacterium]|jgi:CheY-like chemotaxis protein
MGGRSKILVVDDNLNFLQLIDVELSMDHEILTALDGQEGLDKAKAEHPDVILMDVMMPKVSGLEMLRMLLADEETRDIPVLIMTASHFDPSTEMIFKQERNVKGFLQKPYTISVLKEAISAAVKK